MTADEYDCILCPTDEDFRTWTADLFLRAVLACQRVDKLYPDLGRKKTEDGQMPLFEDVYRRDVSCCTAGAGCCLVA